MKGFSLSLAALTALGLILVLGCDSSGRPLIPVPEGTVTLSGVVSYPNGQPVDRAKILTDTGATTFSDSFGHYAIAMVAPGDSVTVSASDAYDGRAHAVIHFGSARVFVGDRGATADIVLDYAQPI